MESDARKEALAAEADLAWRQQILSAAAPEVEKEQQRQAQADELARSRGIRLMRDGHRDGKHVMLVGDQLGIAKGLGLDAAKSIQADKLWPGGGANQKLTGAGMTVGLWDFTQVRTTHVEFAGVTIPRVVNVDSGMAAPNSDSTSHSTAVAGAILSAGISNYASIGIAHGASLRARDLTDDFNEVREEANSSGQLKLSSHGYGLISGWETINSGTYKWRAAMGRFGYSNCNWKVPAG